MIFLPYLGGERTPHNDAAIRGCFVGLSYATDRDGLTRAVLEGVAFAFADCLAALRQAGAASTRASPSAAARARATGCEIIANMLDIAVDVPEDGDFGAALRRGAARPDRRRGRRPVRGLRAAEDPRDDRARPRRASTALCRSLRALSRALSRHQGGDAAMNCRVSSASKSRSRSRGKRGQSDPLAFRWYDPDRSGARQAHGGPSALRRLLLALLRLAGQRSVRRRDLRCGRGCSTAIAMAQARLKADVAFEMFRLLGVPFFTFHDRDVAPEGATLRRVEPNVRAIADIFAQQDGEDRRPAALGHGEPVLQPPLHGGRGDQSRPGRLRLCRGAGEERARR